MHLVRIMKRPLVPQRWWCAVKGMLLAGSLALNVAAAERLPLPPDTFTNYPDKTEPQTVPDMPIAAIWQGLLKLASQPNGYVTRKLIG